MSNNSKKRKIKFKGIFLIAFMIYAVYSLVNQQIMINKLVKVKEQKQLEIERVAAENEKLRQMIKTSNTDEYMEKMAREQLGMVKPGEKVYIDTNVQDKVK